MESFLARYETQRQRIRPEIEAFFHALPPSLTTLGWAFAQRLSGETALTHEFADAFKVPHVARIVYLPLWQTAAYRRRGIPVPDQDAFCADLFVSCFLGFCAIRIHDDLLDRDKPHVQVSELLLANLFTMEAIRRLQRRFPSDSPLWNYHLRFWADYTHAVRTDQLRDQAGLASFDRVAFRQIGDKSALLKTFPVAVALHADQPHDVDPLIAMMDDFNTGVQLANDLQSLRRDLEARHYTPPIALAALAGGYRVGTHPPLEGLYGALLTTNAIAEVTARARRCFERARDASLRLGIDDVTECLTWHLTRLRESRPFRHSVPFPPAQSRSGTRRRRPPVCRKPDCLRIALDFLEDDPECREAWEVQRQGLWGRSLLIGDLFNRSLVLDVLAEQGRAVSGRIEKLLKRYERHGWRYYRDFKALPPDIDDVGQALHLLRWVPWAPAVRDAYLAVPFRWLTANRNPDGGFPVWLTEAVDDRPASGWIPLGGAHCLACEANLLTALSGCETSRSREWIVAGAESLLRRWDASRYNGVFYYTPAYASFLLARCFTRLADRPWMTPDLARRLREHAHDVVRGIDRSSDTTPLALASTVLARLHGPEPSCKAIAEGLSLLEQQQDGDGGWPGAALFRRPGGARRDLVWHASRLLTAAVAARALAQGRARLRGCPESGCVGPRTSEKAAGKAREAAIS